MQTAMILSGKEFWCTVMRLAVRSTLNDRMWYIEENISVLDGNIRMWDKSEDDILGWPCMMAREDYGRMQLCSFTDIISESVWSEWEIVTTNTSF
jgi:hypothetical protein